MPSLLRLLALLCLLVVVALAPSIALGQAGGNRLDGIRDDVKKLEAEGAYEAALKLLRAVVPDSLDPAARLELEQRTDTLVAKQNEQYAKDRAAATDLAKAGKFTEASATLEKVTSYGSKKQVDEAAGDQARYKEGAAKAEAAGKVKQEEEKKKRAANSVVDKKNLEKAVTVWLEARKQLACSKCHGAGHYTCPTCEGSGKVRAQPLGSFRGAGVPDYIDCAKCKATGQVKCGTDNCNGTGYSRYKVEAVIWSVWPKSFRDQIEANLATKKTFIDQMTARVTTGKSDAPLVDAVFDVLKEAWLTPVRGHDAISITMSPEEGTATATYVLHVSQNDHRETTQWLRAPDGAWGMVPPELAAAPAAKPGAGAGASDGTKAPK